MSYRNTEKRLGNCYWPFKSAFITAEGRITPCCIRMHREHAFGDILSLVSLQEIWSSPAYLELRKSRLAYEPLPGLTIPKTILELSGLNPVFP